MSRVLALMRMGDFYHDSGDIGIRWLLDNEYRMLMKDFIVQGDEL